jgi:hypothetical protein
MPRAVGGNRGAIIVQVGPRRAETPGDRTGNRQRGGPGADVGNTLSPARSPI